MWNWMCLAIVGILAGIAIPSHAFNPGGTLEVQFRPMRSQGITEGCTLTYRVIGQDHLYKNGNLVLLVGSITIWSLPQQRDDILLILRIGVIDTLGLNASPVAPFFAYLQTSHGTTAKSFVGQKDLQSHPGARDFYFYQLQDDALKAYMDIVSGEPVAIGFNRNKDGLDVRVPLDLHVADSSLSPDGSIVPRKSDEMLLHFATCVNEMAQQALKR